MPITMGGMASGMDTDAIIDKLIQHEARPIRQLEEQKYESNQRKEALKKLETLLKDVNRTVKDLYGFRATYDNKSVISSNPAAVEARATKMAEKGLRHVQVMQLASTHKITSDELKDEKKLPAGTFSVEVEEEETSIRFRGGNLEALQERIQELAGEQVVSSVVKTREGYHVLTMESKVPGKKGEMILRGDMALLKEAGIVSGEKGAGEEMQKVTFDSRYFKGYAGKDRPAEDSGTLSVAPEGNEVAMEGLLWRDYTLPVSQEIKEETILSFDFTHQLKEEAEEEPVPERVVTGPTEKVTIKGIELEGYNIPRYLPKEPKEETPDFATLLGIGVVTSVDGQRKEKIYPIETDATGRQELPVGNDFADAKVDTIVLYTNDGKATFRDFTFVTPQKGEGVLEPKNITTEAGDAKLKVDGIEVTRERNEELDDVVKGLVLNLKGTSERPVELKINADLDDAVERIQAFVEAYNKYIDYHKSMIHVEKSERPGDYDEKKQKQGLFVGDMMMLRLEQTMNRTVTAAYSSRAEKPIRMISELGISTGALNANWASIKDGKLVVEDDTLRKTLQENPEGVKLFFGSDSDGDNRVDTGMAYNLEQRLDPYISFGKNIIQSKIELEDTNIDLANDSIDRHREHLKSYEEKLRAKFARMEQSMSGMKQQQNWMNQQMGGGSSNDK